MSDRPDDRGDAARLAAFRVALTNVPDGPSRFFDDVKWLLAKVDALTAENETFKAEEAEDYAESETICGQLVDRIKAHEATIAALEADKRQLQRDVNYWVELRSVDSRPVIADGNCSSHVLSE